MAFNLGTGEGHSIFEVIAAAERITGHRVPTILDSRRNGDPPRLVASADLARSELNWASSKGLDDIILTAWNYLTRRRLPHQRSGTR